MRPSTRSREVKEVAHSNISTVVEERKHKLRKVDFIIRFILITITIEVAKGLKSHLKHFFEQICKVPLRIWSKLIYLPTCIPTCRVSLHGAGSADQRVRAREVVALLAI